MRNFQIKSILLGIGIGIVITSIISMIYAAGINTNNGLSREEIISKARELGMVESTSVLNGQQSTTDAASDSNDDKIDIPDSKTGTNNENTKQEISSSENTQDKSSEAANAAEIKITINPGDTSEAVASKLQDHGLIKEKKDFISKLVDMGLASEINIGEFKIKESSNVTEIIRVITGTK